MNRFKKTRQIGSNIYKLNIKKGNTIPATKKKGSLFNYKSIFTHRQALRFFYPNIKEKQLKKIYNNTLHAVHPIHTSFFSFLERRLDSFLFRMNFVKTPFTARQYISHGHVKVNGIITKQPSYILRPNDYIELDSFPNKIEIHDFMPGMIDTQMKGALFYRVVTPITSKLSTFLYR